MPDGGVAGVTGLEPATSGVTGMREIKHPAVFSNISLACRTRRNPWVARLSLKDTSQKILPRPEPPHRTALRCSSQVVQGPADSLPKTKDGHPMGRAAEADGFWIVPHHSAAQRSSQGVAA